jgi:hypothetical protein
MRKGQLEQQVDIHDRSQFEIRLNYDQELTSKKNCYRVESFLFFPRSLRVDSHHYNKEVFYQDLKTNLRLRTPTIAISKLVDSDDSSSLRVRIDAPFNRLLAGRARKTDVDDIAYELKVFGTIFRGQVCDQVNNLIDLVDQVKEDIGRYPTICSDIQKLLKLFIKEINHAFSVFRKLRAKFLNPIIPAALNLILEEINEFISLVIDTHLSRLALAIRDVPGLSEIVGGPYLKLMQLLQKESRYREGAGYLSGNPTDHEGEKYIYRKSELKKSIMEVLFLRPKVGKEGIKTSQGIAMIAAGAAMVWALTALVLGGNAFVINSVPFLFLMVFSYIVKDRIKDSIKQVLHQKILARFFHDRKIEFYNHKTKRLVGRVRESFQFVDKNQIPEDVLQARYPVNSGRRFETIIRHDRVVTFITKEFDRLYSRIASVTRLSINNFLSKMDDADTIMPCYIKDEENVRSVIMSKVYHIHLILKLSSCCKTKKHELRHYRIIVNKEGIKRIEILGPDSSVESIIYHPTLRESLIDPEDISEELEVPLAHTTLPTSDPDLGEDTVSKEDPLD